MKKPYSSNETLSEWYLTKLLTYKESYLTTLNTINIEKEYIRRMLRSVREPVIYIPCSLSTGEQLLII